MQSDGGLVEYVERSDERAAQRGGQVDALCLAATQRVGGSIQREVAQSHADKIVGTGAQLFHQARRDGLLTVGQLQRLDPLCKVADGHTYQFGDTFSADFDVVGIFAQPAAVAVGTDGLAAEACQHHTVLYLVVLRLHPFEEAVDAFPVAVAVPQDVVFLLRQLVVRLVDGETHARRQLDEHLLPFVHLLAAPTDHRIFIDG